MNHTFYTSSSVGVRGGSSDKRPYKESTENFSIYFTLFCSGTFSTHVNKIKTFVTTFRVLLTCLSIAMQKPSKVLSQSELEWPCATI